VTAGGYVGDLAGFCRINHGHGADIMIGDKYKTAVGTERKLMRSCAGGNSGDRFQGFGVKRGDAAGIRNPKVLFIRLESDAPGRRRQLEPRHNFPGCSIHNSNTP